MLSAWFITPMVEIPICNDATALHSILSPLRPPT